MRRFVSLLLCLTIVLCLGPAVRAADIVNHAVTGGNIQFDRADGTVTGCDASVTEAYIPEMIEGVRVVAIGEGAFSRCPGLQRVSIPDGVTGIGPEAFQWCFNLTGVTLPDSVTAIGRAAFSRCSNLTEITLPAGLTSIDGSMFDSCYSMTRVVSPKDVTSVGAWAFHGCTALTDVYYGGTWAEYAANLLPNVDDAEGFNCFFLNANFHFQDSTGDSALLLKIARSFVPVLAMTIPAFTIPAAVSG